MVRLQTQEDREPSGAPSPFCSTSSVLHQQGHLTGRFEADRDKDPTKWQLASFLFLKKIFFFFKFPRTPEEATLGVHPPHLLHQATDAAISGGHRKCQRGQDAKGEGRARGRSPAQPPRSAFKGPRPPHLGGPGECTFPGLTFPPRTDWRVWAWAWESAL